MELQYLPTFKVFAETLSLTETGRRLGLTQPAVHGQIQRLATSVGETLYLRQGRILVLTPAGERLATLARDVQRAVQHWNGPLARPRLVAGRGAWLHVLPDILGDHLLQLHPLVADGPRAADAVASGRAELGVAVRPDPERFETHPLRTGGSSIVAPPGTLLPPSFRTDDLHDGPWVLPPGGRPLRLAIDERVGRPLQVTATCSDWSIALSWVRQGLGWTIVNDCVATDLPTSPWVDGPRYTYTLFWRRGHRPPLLDALISGR